MLSTRQDSQPKTSHPPLDILSILTTLSIPTTLTTLSILTTPSILTILTALSPMRHNANDQPYGKKTV